MGLQQKIIKGEFLRNTVTLVTGTAIAQFIGIILYPVLSRLFTASEFGLLSTISQISAIIMVLA
ncbi:MAG TPA: polysaccharide biosynthesis protein, partial [Bacillota bacterium]|nr:polysaccharide biosynthesis protein [Bacillota bacterium]